MSSSINFTVFNEMEFDFRQKLDVFFEGKIQLMFF